MILNNKTILQLKQATTGYIFIVIVYVLTKIISLKGSFKIWLKSSFILVNTMVEYRSIIKNN